MMLLSAAGVRNIQSKSAMMEHREEVNNEPEKAAFTMKMMSAMIIAATKMIAEDGREPRVRKRCDRVDVEQVFVASFIM